VSSENKEEAFANKKAVANKKVVANQKGCCKLRGCCKPRGGIYNFPVLWFCNSLNSFYNSNPLS
jgi:hypothetical protein